jgi:hypothetical protein
MLILSPDEPHLMFGGRRHLIAPRVLELGRRDHPATIKYINDIRASVGAGDGAFVDLKWCSGISAGACLMLCAEIELSNYLHSDSVGGRDPDNFTARDLLQSFGFHEHLGFRRRRVRKESPRFQTLRIRSGAGPGADVSKHLGEIADLARSLYGSAEIGGAVHRSLNEAMTNISGHAYKGADPRACMPGRWWFAGYCNKRLSKARFYAYDHGVGIPSRAPETMAAALIEYWNWKAGTASARLSAWSDRRILEAAVRARRVGIDVGTSGRGFPAMIGLIEESANEGLIHVMSRRARYLYGKRSNGVHFETCRASRSPTPGTLVVWELGRHSLS